MSLSSSEKTAPRKGNEVDEVVWYKERVGSIPEATKEILVRWSGIPELELEKHIHNIRSSAFETYPYPCIGQLRFLSLNFADHELYQVVLSTLKNKKSTFLDAGCCFGQELRKLASDGAPPETLYGLDLEPAFIEMGFELFRDREKLSGATFLSGDMLDAKRQWPELEGSIDYIFANSLLHLFPRPQQLEMACRLASFARDRPGSLIIGRQVGAVVPGEFRALSEGSTYFRHNPESFDALWREVGRLTGTRWKTNAYLDMKDIAENASAGPKWMDEHSRRLHFVVERVDLNANL